MPFDSQKEQSDVAGVDTHGQRERRGHNYRRSYGGDPHCETSKFRKSRHVTAAWRWHGVTLFFSQCSRAAISALTSATCASSSFKLISWLRSKTAITSSAHRGGQADFTAL